MPRPFDNECPPPEKIALLRENGLAAVEREEILLHMAGCNECALTYTLAGAMEEPGTAKRKPVLFQFRRLARAALFVLAAGAGFAGGALYNEHARLAPRFEPSPLYWSRLNDAALRPAQSGRIVGTRGAASPPAPVSVQEILSRKRDFDLRLSKITNLSGQDIDAVLGVGGVDILAMTPEDIKNYASFLKDGRAAELQKAEKWIRFNQSAFFSLAVHLPPEVWELYPVSEESLKTLSNIALEQ